MSAVFIFGAGICFGVWTVLLKEGRNRESVAFLALFVVFFIAFVLSLR